MKERRCSFRNANMNPCFQFKSLGQPYNYHCNQNSCRVWETRNEIRAVQNISYLHFKKDTWCNCDSEAVAKIAAETVNVFQVYYLCCFYMSIFTRYQCLGDCMILLWSRANIYFVIILQRYKYSGSSRIEQGSVGL